MREIVLDTETTGFDPYDGDRIVEIGAVELYNHMPTGNVYHVYINPERTMPQSAFEVHGLGDDFLRDKPVFAKIAQSFVDFVKDDKMVIHNASFDMRFLNYELGLLNYAKMPDSQAIDTLEIARRKFPGSPASLDALCRRFGVDNSAREKHGALLDSEILAEVYLQLIGGQQPGFELAGAPAKKEVGAQLADAWQPKARPQPLPPRISEDEKAAHAAFVASLGGETVWSKLKS